MSRNSKRARSFPVSPGNENPFVAEDDGFFDEDSRAREAFLHVDSNGAIDFPSFTNHSRKESPTTKNSSTDSDDENDSDYTGSQGDEVTTLNSTPLVSKRLTRSQVFPDFTFEELDDEAFLFEERTLENSLPGDIGEDNDDDIEQNPWEKYYHGEDDDDDDHDDEDGDGVSKDDEDDEAEDWEPPDERDEMEDDLELLNLEVTPAEVEALHEASEPFRFMTPDHIKRIRKATREHIQLLIEVMMIAKSDMLRAGAKIKKIRKTQQVSPIRTLNGTHEQQETLQEDAVNDSKNLTIFETCVGMLNMICDRGKQCNFEKGIFRVAKPEVIENLLESFKLDCGESALEDVPTNWKSPLLPKFEMLLNKFSTDLEFSSALFPEHRRIPAKKLLDSSSSSAPPDGSRKKPVVWRNWSDEEIKLVVLGFDRFGGTARAVTQKIHTHLLPVREPHIMTRIIHEASEKNRGQERYARIRDWLERYPHTEIRGEEKRRLLHGIALQNVKTIDKIDFEQISKTLLPHISGLMLRKRFEQLVQKEKAKRSASSGESRNVSSTPYIDDDGDTGLDEPLRA